MPPHPLNRLCDIINFPKKVLTPTSRRKSDKRIKIISYDITIAKTASEKAQTCISCAKGDIRIKVIPK